ncbi:MULTISPECIES: YsnF/AvaK domain-containing protein [Spirosoma]|uniref:DUF2382 domain-containing protein n=1 Tax=Spirosoma sordidisoli TaxID=2502893 RepID=A0A4Q2UVI8_9BACT|nr:MULTISPECIES: YsnF/AvaK domain-containing protein [Spirosoma]RYC70949.1 DUF2382 domain-containing protein [Spirosoma sordidisoli]
MALTVIGVFDDATEAQQAVDALVSDGFSRSNIDLSAQKTAYSDSEYIADNNRVEEDRRDSGGIGGFFSSLFGSDDDDDARRLRTVAERGTLVTVHVQTADEAERSADILDDNGAVDVDERAAQYNTTADYDSSLSGSSATMGAGVVGNTVNDLTDSTDLDRTVAERDVAYTDQDRVVDADQTIKVIQEDLQVGKRDVERGGVRVRSRIVERPVEESLRLREERVHVQRTPVNRPANADDLNAFQEGQIELREHAEIPVVSKTANVVEEISIGKEVSEREETIRDTVRSTDVDIENLDSSVDPSLRSADRRTDLDDDTTYGSR